MYSFAFKDLPSADFISGSIYESNGGGFANEPLHELFKVADLGSVGTQSGIRRSMLVDKKIKEEAYIVLVNTHSIDEWKNVYNPDTNILTYFGDNKTPGKNILDTKQRGNLTFQKLFNRGYGSINERMQLPPIFYFERTGVRSDMRFIGLALPFVEGMTKEQALQKRVFSSNDGEFENYIAHFTIVPKLTIKREWLYDLKLNRKDYSPYAPKEWLDFINKGTIENNNSINYVEKNSYELIDPIYTQHTKEMIVQARLTQNKFRQGLLETQRKCQICGIDIPELLVASHIKPWIISDDTEKIDLNNGLLLCANHDKLFDRKLITFDSNGNLLISPEINDKELLELLNLKSPYQMVVTEKQEKYLAHHRRNF